MKLAEVYLHICATHNILGNSDEALQYGEYGVVLQEKLQADRRIDESKSKTF